MYFKLLQPNEDQEYWWFEVAMENWDAQYSPTKQEAADKCLQLIEDSSLDLMILLGYPQKDAKTFIKRILADKPHYLL